MKERRQNLERTDPKLFNYALQIILKVYNYNNSTQCFQLTCTYDQDLYTKMNLSLQDHFMTILKNSLNEQNTLTTLMIAHETNALKNYLINTWILL